MKVSIERRKDVVSRIRGKCPSPDSANLKFIPETKLDKEHIEWLKHLAAGDFSFGFAGYRGLEEVFEISLRKGSDFRERVEELAKCKKDCHAAGHYECWKDNCNCICHAARQVLGIVLPESYIPVPKED